MADRDRQLTPLGQLLEQARTERLGISGREAARRAGISETRWRQAVTGVQPAGGGVKLPAKPTRRTVVAMALAVQVDPAMALQAAGFDADPELTAQLVADVRGEQAATAPRSTPQSGDELAAEVDRIRHLPMSAAARRKLIRSLIAVYEEAAEEDRRANRAV